jgi:hypothetical protein
MPEAVAPEVQRECRALTRWLVGAEPDDYVISRYARGLASATFREGARRGSADGVLAAVGRTGRPGLALAHTWARFFAPAGAFRRRAVLLSAILESAPPAFAAFEPPRAGRLRAWSALVGAGLLFVVRLVAALLIIGPLHLVAHLTRGRRGPDEQPG